MVNIFIFLLLCCLIACSGKPSPVIDPQGFQFINANISWPVIPESEEFSWTTTGFLAHKEHPYGFDKHPNPSKYNSEDSVTHVSVLANADGMVNAFVDPLIYNSSTGYKYGLCDLQTKKILRELQPNQQGFDEYDFYGKSAGSVDSIGLCRKLENSVDEYYIIYEKLKIHSYEPIQKAVGLFVLGDGKTASDFVQSSQFWETAIPDVFYKHIFYPNLTHIYYRIPQNISLYRDNSGDVIDSTVKSTDYLKIHVANTDTSCYESVKDDIDKAVENIRQFSQETNLSRIILALTWPTRKIWSLKYDAKGFVQLCGIPNDSPESASEIQLVSGEEGVEYTPYVVHKKGNYWVAVKKDQTNRIIEDTLTSANVDVSQMVFIESGRLQALDNPYLDSHLHSSTTKAVTVLVKRENDNLPFEYDFAYILLPWRNERTGRILLHEMGHLFGLVDLNDIVVKDDNSNQGNLMHWNDDRNGVLLRNRPIDAQFIEETKEQQWDCLHQNKASKTCADPSFLQFNHGD